MGKHNIKDDVSGGRIPGEGNTFLKCRLGEIRRTLNHNENDSEKGDV